MHVLAQEGGPIDAVFASFENTMLWMLVGISFILSVPSGAARTSRTR